MPAETVITPDVEDLVDEVHSLEGELESAATQFRYLDTRLTDVTRILDRWHDEHHGAGRRHHCHEQPCRDVTAAVDAT